MPFDECVEIEVDQDTDSVSEDPVVPEHGVVLVVPAIAFRLCSIRATVAVRALTSVGDTSVFFCFLMVQYVAYDYKQSYECSRPTLAEVLQTGITTALWYRH